ncbi:MAG TPA: efflux transporter outer membrane subunit [Moraxellaceae bacterium]|nr:efflux transporter outer membrane subunit [Moraxellaceae bacterium]
MMCRKPSCNPLVFALVLAVGGTLAGCAGPRMPALTTPLPPTWSRPPVAPATPAPDLQHWWTIFADPLLDQLVRTSLDGNLDLVAARQRLQGARALAAHSGDAYLPEFHAHAQPVQSPDGVDSFFQYGLDASWELGLFGRRRSAEWVARSHALSAEAELQALRVSLVAEVARTYIELRAAQQVLALHRNLESLERQRVDLLDARARIGVGAVGEVTRARAAHDQEVAALPLQQQAVDVAALRLALLLGQVMPEPAWLNPAPLPVAAIPALTGVPADLLRTRPDIHMAEAAVMESAGELGIARSELYPYVGIGGELMYSLNLTGNFTIDGDNLHLISSIGPTIDLPLFDWGRRKAAADARAAALEAAVTSYRKAVISAVNEVVLALAVVNGAQASRAAVQNALQQHDAGVESQRSLQQLGLSSPLQMLDANRELLQACLGMVEADAGQGLALVSLYKALGGASLPAVAEKD